MIDRKPRQIPGANGKTTAPLAMVVKEATFLGETGPVSLPLPVKFAVKEATGVIEGQNPFLRFEEGPPAFLLGLHATGPALGSGSRDKRDSLIGISPPVPTGSHSTFVGGDSAFVGGDSAQGVPIPILYWNPFTGRQIRPSPLSEPIGDVEPFMETFDGPLEVAVTLWHGPPAIEGDRSGPITDNEGNVIGDTGTIGDGEDQESLAPILLGPGDGDDGSQGPEPVVESGLPVFKNNPSCVIVCCYDADNSEFEGLVDPPSDLVNKVQQTINDQFENNPQLTRQQKKWIKKIAKSGLDPDEEEDGVSIPLRINEKVVIINIVPCFDGLDEDRNIGETGKSREGEGPTEKQKRELAKHEQGHAIISYLGWLFLRCNYDRKFRNKELPSSFAEMQSDDQYKALWERFKNLHKCYHNLLKALRKRGQKEKLVERYGCTYWKRVALQALLIQCGDSIWDDLSGVNSNETCWKNLKKFFDRNDNGRIDSQDYDRMVRELQCISSSRDAPGDSQSDGNVIEMNVTPGRPIDVFDCTESGAEERDGAGGDESFANDQRPSTGAGPQCDVPVGIKGTAEFDPAEDLDVGSLRLGVPEVIDGGGGAEPLHDGHARKMMPYSYRTDPHEDLLVHFPARGTGLTRDSSELKLVGKTEGSRRVEASTEVRYRSSVRRSGR